MKIGFDAKRAFFNRTGLGNYSRSTIAGLSRYFPDNDYNLYTPKPHRAQYETSASNVFIKGPDSAFYKKFPSLWRTHGIPGQCKKDRIDIFHGLSNEIPFGIEKTKIPAVATMCDIIFINHPELYPPIDRNVYKKKLENVIKNASKIITISNQTRDDLILTCNVSEDQIRVVYLSCASVYWKRIDESRRMEVVRKYKLPDTFILNVGTIETRKNILSVVKAIHKRKIAIPLVVVGRPTPYLDEVNAYIENNGVRNVYFLHDVPFEDLPALYQHARIFVYPSIFEGFGMPILESLVSQTPVITTKGGCFEEAGGPSTVYIDPQNSDQIAEAILYLLKNETCCDEMRRNGLSYADKFTLKNIAAATMDVYREVL